MAKTKKRSTKKGTRKRKGGSKKGETALKKIVAEAKKIRKRSPGKQWKTCVKEAGVRYRAGKL